MPTKPQPKTRQQLLEERRAEFDAIQQTQARHEAERAERERENNEFMARVQQRREAIDGYIKHSWAQRADMPMTESQMAQARAEIEQAAIAQVKIDRPAGLDPIFRQKRVDEQAAELEALRAQVREQQNPSHWVNQYPMPITPQRHKQQLQARFAQEAQELGLEPRS